VGTQRITVAVDAMGGDNAPGEIVRGALDAVTELGVDVLLVGRENAIASLLPDGRVPGVEVEHADDVVTMDEDPAAAARRKKDSSLVRTAQAVREGRAQAMVGAGNTGATMAAALLRMGRVRGISRPAIAVPIPVPAGTRHQLLIDGGSTVDCTPEWLAQFARMGREYARTRLSVDEPTVGLLSNGEEPRKGDELRKRTFSLLEKVPGFQGNVEGRDLMHGTVDVVVTDGFTGNVVLKTLEGGLRALVNALLLAFGSTPEYQQHADARDGRRTPARSLDDADWICQGRGRERQDPRGHRRRVAHGHDRSGRRDREGHPERAVRTRAHRSAPAAHARRCRAAWRRTAGRWRA